MIEYGKLTIDPLKNPAVLDTSTWNPNAAATELTGKEDSYFTKMDGMVKADGVSWSLPTLSDGQRVIAAVCRGDYAMDAATILYTRRLDDGNRILCYETNNDILDLFCRQIAPAAGPRALGSTPRLGIGCRMSTAVWPGIWKSMHTGGFAANAIQNSLRELNLLEDLKAGKTPRTNYQFSFGEVQEGHTGSSFEGLWNQGVLSALDSGLWPRYGADADHIMVKRAPDGLERAKEIINASRYYSFYTLDVSDLLDYTALSAPAAGGIELLEQALPDDGERKSIVAFHRLGRSFAGVEYKPSEGELAGLFGKYHRALEAAGELKQHLDSLKAGVPFDLELSVDENPPEVNTCDNRTSDTELIFLLLESERRGLGLSHIAPNLGVEKGVDYRCEEGLEELGQRLRRQNGVAGQFGVMIDCHSGDDLSQTTRRVIGEATQGIIHFKVSPSLQVLFGEVLFDTHPDLFQVWWEDALSYAKREGEKGSSIAAESLAELESSVGKPCPGQPVFHHFNFATLGRRDDKNRFLSRDWFYSLPSDVYSEYTNRLERFLSVIANDVFGR